ELLALSRSNRVNIERLA
ncbi:hypothetical protein, partial [Halopiger goleimassiliensis]